MRAPRRPSPRTLALAAVLALPAAATAGRGPQEPEGLPARMAAATQAFLGGLDDAGRVLARAPFDEPERRTWAFGPVRREGIDLGALDEASFGRLEALLDTALSEQGMECWREIRALEPVLFAKESRPGKPASHRNPDLYWLRIYGEPGGDSAWSWRFEGHHIALHVTCTPGETPAVTPFFIGANPLLDVPVEGGAVREVGVAAFTRLRAAADRLLDAIGETAGDLDPGTKPGDVRMGPGKDALPPLEGLDVVEFSPSQVEAARGLLDTYLALLDEPLRTHALSPDAEDATFAHWGQTSVRGERAWALVTESFALELVTTDGPHHVHALLRGPKSDFGGPAKAPGEDQDR